MGDRAQVHIEDTDVYLYTHWQGHNLPETVRSALAREERWNDPAYLARIIFDEMVGDDNGSTGFGIQTEQQGDVYRVIHVNCEHQTVRPEYGTLRGPETNSETYSFEEYVDLEAPVEWPEPP